MVSGRGNITGLLGLSVALWMSGAGLAAAKSTADLHENLVRAVCLNDWVGALALVDPLIATPGLTPTYRQAMVDLRDQLAQFHKAGTVIREIDRCETALQRYVPASAVPPARHLDWAGAINFVLGTLSQLPPRTQAVSQQQAIALAHLDTFDRSEIAALSPAIVIDMQSGSGVSAGAVGSREQIYTFFGGLGDRVTIDVDVTRILPGQLARNDDTQVFLFDATGALLAANDDAGESLQSRLEAILLPRTGRYYVAVTTYDNAPILDEADRILDWRSSGGSAVEYTLTIRGVTPTAELILTNYGPE